MTTDVQLGDSGKIPFLSSVVLGAFWSIDNEVCAGKKASVCSLHKILLNPDII